MKPVRPGLWRIPLAGHTVNAYVWLSDRGLTLVDCGYPGSGTAIVQALRSAGHDPESVHQIIVTHGDVDHMGGLVALQRATHAQVLAHKREVAVIEGTAVRPWGSGWWSQLLGRSVDDWSRRALVHLHRSAFGHPLNHGDVLDGGWSVIHTPGHTPGHISLYHPADGVLITGDALGRRGSRICVPREVYAADVDQARASAMRLAGIQAHTVCPGHRAPLYDVGSADWRRFADAL